jgi:hypothetical protein
MSINPLLVIMLICSFFGAFFLIASIHAVKKIRLFRALRSSVFMVLFVVLTALSGILIIANHGYRALLQEELAATVTIEPMDARLFTARVKLPDGTVSSYVINGDQLYVDAHILKWHPWLNLVGVHTTYELDRIGGRYITLEDERTKPHTVHTLSKSKVLDMFNLRRRWMALKPLLDAEYGSATFIGSDRPATFQVMVSTSGLLVREEEDRN